MNHKIRNLYLVCMFIVLLKLTKWQKIGHRVTENLFCEGPGNWHKS